MKTMAKRRKVKTSKPARTKVVKRDTQLEANIESHRKPDERVLMRLAYANSFRSKMPLALIGGRYGGGNFRYVGQPRWSLAARRCEVRHETVHALAAMGHLARDWDSMSVIYRITREGKKRVASLMQRLSGKGK